MINNKPRINKPAAKAKTRGVTLVELMIAITIGSIIAIGIGSVYTSSKRSFKLQEEFSRMQENGRFAMNYIARFVRGAGYSGCASGLSNMINDIDSTGVELMFQTGLEGYEAAGTAPNETIASGDLAEYPTASSTAADFTTNTSTGEVAINSTTLTALGVLPKSDILIARVADDSGVEITTNNGSAEFTINWTGTEANACTQNNPDTDRLSDICENDFLVVSDCSKSIAFQVSSITKIAGNLVKITHTKSGSPGNKSASWGAAGGKADPGFDFVEGDEIVKVTTKFFYIGKGVSGPALFLKTGTNTGTELVEGVENIQVLYGEDTDATPDNVPDRYVPANQVTDFGNISAVRISILLRSVKNLPWRTAAEKTYLLGGTTAATATTVTSPSDQRLRRTMSMTIKLRNRAFSL